MKVGILYNITEGLSELSDKELPMSVALSVKRNQVKLEAELSSVDEIRNKIINKYKDYERDDGSIQLKTDKIDDFNNEYSELMNEEIEVDLIEINLNGISDINIKPSVLNLLDPILTDIE